MHGNQSLAEQALPAQQARHGGPGVLARLLREARADTLALFARYEAALPGLQVPRKAGLNPPLWELGHIGWFQGWWTSRFPAWRQGWRADPATPRGPAQPADADALYNSSAVAHGTRWSLPLPGADATRQALALQLQATLELLAQVAEDAADLDAALYPFRLALLHEDMHHEAALYMAAALGIAIDDPRWQPAALPEPPPALALPASRWVLGRDADAPGFAFDNECGHLAVDLPASTIDAQVLRWAEYLPAVEAGSVPAPPHLRREGGRWWRERGGRIEALDLREAACHLSQAEALAWCRWAGRRLPTEAEWERAALKRGAAFRWGDVWEWTSSAFEPWPGFAPHPYRDYSAPWFDGRPVLRGASFMTQPRLRDLRYRNFFEAHRHDVPAGFRSCAA